MKHINALVVLFIAVIAVFSITLGWAGGATFGQVLLTALVFTIAGYFIGDLIVLPATNTWVGILVDAVALWAVLRLIVPTIANGSILFWTLGLVGVFAYFYHLYLYQTVIGIQRKGPATV